MILKHTKAYEYIEAVEKLHEMIEYSNYREHKIECSEKKISHIDEEKRKYEEAILNDSKVMDAVNKRLIIESTAEKVDRLERGSNTYARKLRGPFKEYLDVLAEEDNSFVDSERIDVS